MKKKSNKSERYEKRGRHKKQMQKNNNCNQTDRLKKITKKRNKKEIKYERQK